MIVDIRLNTMVGVKSSVGRIPSDKHHAAIEELGADGWNWSTFLEGMKKVRPTLLLPFEPSKTDV